MRTSIHTPEERKQMRARGGRLAQVCQVQLWCAVSLLRTTVTEVLPLCGSALWWVAPACLLPGLAVFVLLTALMRRSTAATLTQAAERLTGRAGARLLCWLMSALLLLDGAASMTALVTIFTEGIGTEGTQITMAALTLAAVAASLHRDGLSWGIWLMRRGVLAVVAVIVGFMLSMIRLDGLHPLLGQGMASVLAACRAGAAMGWRFALLLLVEDTGRGYGRRVILPVVAQIGAGLLLCLMYPCEVLVRQGGLAQRLLLAVVHLPPALRTVAHGLGMLLLLLTIASAVQMASRLMLKPLMREAVWLPYALAILLALTQCLNIRLVWSGLNTALQWLPMLLGAFALLMLLRRKRWSDASR